MTKHWLRGPSFPAASNSKTIFRPPRFSRFLFAGLVNAIAGFLLFLLFFNAFGWHYLLSNFLVFSSWAWVGYELQRQWVFKVRASGSSFLRYVVNQVVFMLLGTAMLWVLVEFWSIRPETAYVLAIGAITVGIYLSSRLWVFRRAKHEL